MAALDLEGHDERARSLRGLRRHLGRQTGAHEIAAAVLAVLPLDLPCRRGHVVTSCASGDESICHQARAPTIPSARAGPDGPADEAKQVARGRRRMNGPGAGDRSGSRPHAAP